MALSAEQQKQANERSAKRAAQCTRKVIELMADSDGQIIMNKLKQIEQECLVQRMAWAWRAGYIAGYEDRGA